MRLLFITVMLICVLILASLSALLWDLDFLYACVPFLVAAYLATFKRAELN